MQNFDYTSKKTKTDWEFQVTIRAAVVQNKFDELLESEAKNVTVEGFRKGKAPADMAKKQLDRGKVYEKAISELLSHVYSEIVKKEAFKPVTQPRVELLKAKEGEDFVLIIKVAERPTITIPDYKKIISEIKKNEKAADIWVPGKDHAVKEDGKGSEQKKIALLNKIFEALATKTTIEISEFIIEEEVNRKLSSLVDEVKKLGMTIDDYVRSKGTTVDTLRESYKKEMVDMYKLEILLEEIADEAKITVEKEDLEKILSSIEDKTAREQGGDPRQRAEGNAYMYASILKRQKTLDYLLGL